jgi:hemerythrin-like domain-containing protein
MENEEENLSELAEMVERHVRYEERILFPHLEQKLSDKQLEIIGEQIDSQTLTDNYEDQFWVKSTSL